MIYIIIQSNYKKYASIREPKRPVFINCIKAFIAGGAICLIGQLLHLLFTTYFKFDETTAVSPSIIILIFLSVLLTGLGKYDSLAQWAGGGTAVPITGFANTIASAAIEHKSEGFVLGVGGHMFRIAGPVLVYGMFSAFVVALVKLIIITIGGI